MKITNPASPREVEFESLKLGLTNYNESFTGPVFNEKIASFVKDVDGVFVGGILGEINWNWLHIQGLWIDNSIRKEGWGSKLLEILEQYSLSNGVTNSRLETTTFQALNFYLKAGYTVMVNCQTCQKGTLVTFCRNKLRYKTRSGY